MQFFIYIVLSSHYFTKIFERVIEFCFGLDGGLIRNRLTEYTRIYLDILFSIDKMYYIRNQFVNNNFG